MLQRIEAETGVPVRAEGVFFRMRHGARTVRFFATSGLLDALSHGRAVDEREAFLAYRREIETLAGERYDHRPFDDDSIISITEDALPRQPVRAAEQVPRATTCCA